MHVYTHKNTRTHKYTYTARKNMSAEDIKETEETHRHKGRDVQTHTHTQIYAQEDLLSNSGRYFLSMVLQDEIAHASHSCRISYISSTLLKKHVYFITSGFWSRLATSRVHAWVCVCVRERGCVCVCVRECVRERDVKEVSLSNSGHTYP